MRRHLYSGLGLLVVCLMCMALSACAPYPGEDAPPSAPMGDGVFSYGPDQWGVMCYRSVIGNAMSCLQVMPGVQDDE